MTEPKRLIQWGAGNIGRSFIGQLFLRGGYEVTFVDVNEPLVHALNERGGYTVVEVSDEGFREIELTGCQAILPRKEALRAAVLTADIVSVSVGKTILPRIAPALCDAILYRHERRPRAPLDLLIAENIHDGKSYMARLLTSCLPQGFPLESYLGFIQTSLGKMVPIQRTGELLKVYAEPFNTLIVSGPDFRNGIPDIAGLKAVGKIEAYVDQKLYIHNLGHAAAAYFGYRAAPDCQYLYQVLALKEVLESTREVMRESGELVLKLHPEVFTEQELEEYREDLLRRFCNSRLEDTVFRVGRDLRRKLDLSDRIMGAVLKAYELGLPYDRLLTIIPAALRFTPTGPDGRQDGADSAFLEQLGTLTPRQKVITALGFDQKAHKEYAPLIDRIVALLS